MKYYWDRYQEVLIDETQRKENASEYRYEEVIANQPDGMMKRKYMLSNDPTKYLLFAFSEKSLEYPNLFEADLRAFIDYHGLKLEDVEPACKWFVSEKYLNKLIKQSWKITKRNGKK